MTRAIGSWLMAMVAVTVLAVSGCAEQKPAPAVDETDPGVAANALEESNRRTGVK